MGVMVKDSVGLQGALAMVRDLVVLQGALAMVKDSVVLRRIKTAGLSSKTKAHPKIKAVGEVKSIINRSKAAGNNLEAAGPAKANSNLDGRKFKCFRCTRISNFCFFFSEK